LGDGVWSAGALKEDTFKGTPTKTAVGDLVGDPPEIRWSLSKAYKGPPETWWSPEGDILVGVV
jgi:hypothetical protein